MNPDRHLAWRTVAARSPYGRRTVAVRSRYGRGTVAVWELKRFLHLHEKGILTEVMFFLTIVEICSVSQTATVRRPYGDRTATVRRQRAKPAADQDSLDFSSSGTGRLLRWLHAY
jgi:hypothetical protein